MIGFRKNPSSGNVIKQNTNEYKIEIAPKEYMEKNKNEIILFYFS